MTYPRLCIDTQKLLHNMRAACALAHGQGVSVALVSKVTCANDAVVACIEQSGADMIADSRLLNLRAMHTSLPKLLLRIGMPQDAEAIVRDSDISLESELCTLQMLNDAARAQNRVHQVILMIDLGDLREGLFFRNRAAILKTARFVCEASHLALLGTGVNLTCYGSILPDTENLRCLVSLTEDLRRTLHAPIPLISGGNSSSFAMLQNGTLPKGINHLRLGESVMCGVVPGSYTPIAGFFQDVFTLETVLVELQQKPSVPIGVQSKNAFGETVSYADQGEIVRGICAIGRQDVLLDGLTPCAPDVSILGASSDHLILHMKNPQNYAVGDVLSFRLDYGALLAASTSPYVQKVTRP